MRRFADGPKLAPGSGKRRFAPGVKTKVGNTFPRDRGLDFSLPSIALDVHLYRAFPEGECAGKSVERRGFAGPRTRVAALNSFPRHRLKVGAY